ncbi:MAG: dTDP-4-dehydrorhamnose 3,5-epimerase [Gallionella sp.]
MQFIPTIFAGAYLIEPTRIADERGFFARTYCTNEFTSQGLKANSVQCNISYNKMRGTLRGMHFQRQPNAEAKLVRCTAGAIYDVIIDLRQGSQTFAKWAAFELTAHDRNALYIPEGFAHGFQTLVDDTEVLYQMFNFFVPESTGGVRWNDPAFRIEWPLAVTNMSDKDRAYADFDGLPL